MPIPHERGWERRLGLPAVSAQRGSLETEVNLRLTERHPGGRLLRAHRLEADGSLTVWRITRRRVMD